MKVIEIRRKKERIEAEQSRRKKEEDSLKNTEEFRFSMPKSRPEKGKTLDTECELRQLIFKEREILDDIKNMKERNEELIVDFHLKGVATLNKHMYFRGRRCIEVPPQNPEAYIQLLDMLQEGLKKLEKEYSDLCSRKESLKKQMKRKGKKVLKV